MWTTHQGSAGALSPQECLALLATPGHGLLDLARHPLAEPVRLAFRLVGHRLLLEPVPGSVPLDALVPADATLEVDATDARARRGWHVVVNGRVAAADDGELVLDPDHVTGFRLVPTRSA